MSDPQQPATVAILAYPEATASVVYGMYDLFMATGRDWGIVTSGEAGPSLLRPLVVAARAGPLLATNEVRIEAQASLQECSSADFVCVPDLNIPPGESLEGRFAEEVEWLRRCYAAGATLASACSGTLLLAEAGLLDGQEATVHWAYCDELRRRYPKVMVRAQRALVVSGEGQRLVMAGGGTSWLDLALFLIARSVGVDAAMQVARINLIDWHAIGQQPFARLARTRQVEDAIIAGCQTWIAEHYCEHSPVAAMVRLSGLAERSFKRRFQLATGMSPLDYVHRVRLEEAKQMLESGDDPIEAIANAVGYEDAGFFSRLFRRSVNLTPAQYRRRFGSMRRALNAGV
ncbi:GlxA family transcriptional regulator [Pseudomonas benzenivorans]|nr:helix-turn-helix domain-containing protein [Pseudomonas benzenivorans]